MDWNVLKLEGMCALCFGIYFSFHLNNSHFIILPEKTQTQMQKHTYAFVFW